MSPKVSIIVPCYNQADYIRETLESVLTQTYDNWECIIIDDGSTDNSELIIKQYLYKDKRFKHIGKSNGGVSSARNLGIQNAQGEYILPLDADDYIDPTYLSKGVSLLDSNHHLKLVYAKARMVGLLNEEWKLIPFNYQELLKGHNMIFVSCIYKKEDFLKVGGYCEKMQYGWEDWDFLVRLLYKCNENQVFKINEILFYYRIKSVSRSVLFDNSQNLKNKMLNQSLKNNIEIYIETYPNLFELLIESTYYKKLLNKPIIKVSTRFYFFMKRIKKLFFN